MTHLEDAQDAYQRALERANLLKETWDEPGRPVLATGSRGQPVAHPLLAAMNEADVISDRLRQRLVKAHPGPSPCAVLKPFPSPAAVLRGKNGQ